MKNKYQNIIYRLFQAIAIFCTGAGYAAFKTYGLSRDIIILFALCAVVGVLLFIVQKQAKNIKGV